MDETTQQMQTTVKWKQYTAGMAAAGGAFAVGTALGWSGPAGPALVSGDDHYFEISQEEFDWTSSIVNVGCAVSCLPIGILMKFFGRKWTMLSLVLPFLIGWGLVTWAQNFVMLLIGRFMLGLAGGAFCVSAPQYASEIAEKEIRGIIGTFCVTLINAGILFVYIVGAYVTLFWTNIICAIFPIIFGVIFFLMPESPVYFIVGNREEEAVKSYKWLRGTSYDPQSEIDELKKDIEDTNTNKVSFMENLKRKGTQRALFIGFGLMFFQQASGINVVIFNATAIFEAANTGIDASLQTIIVGTVLLIACAAGGFLVDILGRKALLLISAIGITLMLTALGIYFYLQENDVNVSKLSWVPLTALCIFLISYSLGLGPLAWLLISEVYSKEYNAIASPISGAFNWMLSFAITSTFGSLSRGIGNGPAFWIFAGLSLVGVFFTQFIVIETKARSMVEIQTILAGGKAEKKMKN